MARVGRGAGPHELVVSADGRVAVAYLPAGDGPDGIGYSRLTVRR